MFFLGGVGIDKKQSEFAADLICITHSSETSDRGASSMPKNNYESHHPLMELSTQREPRSNQDDFVKSNNRLLVMKDVS